MDKHLTKYLIIMSFNFVDIETNVLIRSLKCFLYCVYWLIFAMFLTSLLFSLQAKASVCRIYSCVSLCLQCVRGSIIRFAPVLHFYFCYYSVTSRSSKETSQYQKILDGIKNRHRFLNLNEFIHLFYVCYSRDQRCDCISSLFCYSLILEVYFT